MTVPQLPQVSHVLLAQVQSGAEPAPAGGAALDQVLIAAGFTAVVYAGLAWVMWQERRTGRGEGRGRSGAVGKAEGKQEA